MSDHKSGSQGFFQGEFLMLVHGCSSTWAQCSSTHLVHLRCFLQSEQEQESLGRHVLHMCTLLMSNGPFLE